MYVFFKSHVAVNSSNTLSLSELNILLTVVSQLLLSSFSDLDKPFLVSILRWCASSAINTIFFSAKSSSVKPFSSNWLRLMCNPWIVVKQMLMSSWLQPWKLSTVRTFIISPSILISSLNRYLLEVWLIKLSLVFWTMLSVLTKNKKFL